MEMSEKKYISIRRLIATALRYNMDAHRANPANLIAGALGMLINNIIFLLGIWGMLFAGKPRNSDLIPYYVALNTIVMTSWGAVNFFFGGLRSLGELISDGMLETMLGTPRDPILLAGISRSHPIALGDLFMGICGFFVMFYWFTPIAVLKSIMASLISAVAFSALFIAAGSLSFFIVRGSQVAQLLIEISVSLSVYPTGKMFSGAGRILLLLSPAAMTAILPLRMVEEAGPYPFLIACVTAGAFLLGSIAFFRSGVRRYRATHWIGAR